MSKQLTDGFGRAVRPDGMAVGTCLSCKVNKSHVWYKQEQLGRNEVFLLA